jgi:hypothetical protein
VKNSYAEQTLQTQNESKENICIFVCAGENAVANPMHVAWKYLVFLSKMLEEEKKKSRGE